MPSLSASSPAVSCKLVQGKPAQFDGWMTADIDLRSKDQAFVEQEQQLPWRKGLKLPQ